MKIQCSNCGKRFNAEQHMYICPKCNHYHSQVGTDAGHGTTEKPVKKYRWETDPIELDDTPNEEPEFIQTVNGEQTVYTARKKTEESSADVGNLELGKILKKIWMGLCIVGGCIIFIAGPFADMLDIGAWSDDSESRDSDWWSSYNEEIVVDYGNPMEFEAFTVNVGKVGKPVLDGLKAEDGWKLVQVNFETESPYEYESGDIATDVILELSNGEEWDYPQDVYYALYEDEVASERSVEKELNEAGLVVEAHYSGEYFWIFEIPEDVHDVELKITSFISDDEEDWSYTQDETFRMQLEL